MICFFCDYLCNIVDFVAKEGKPSFDNAKIFNEIIQKMDESGGTIYIPTGDFYIDTPIEIDRSYVSVVGENSGLRSGVDSGNNKSQSGGGGSRLIARPNVTVFRIEDKDNQDRISGLTFSNFQIYGQSNNGIGIEGVQDTDRVVVDEVVINSVGIGIKLNGADSISFKKSWISETASSVILSGASQQANISNNAFVASFIGSPAMNLTKVKYSNGRISNENGLDLAVFEPSRRTLDEAGYNNKTVIFGIRPEDIKAEQIALESSPETVITAEITVSELTGAESNLYINVGGTEMVVVVDARDYYKSGETIELAYNMNKAHFLMPRQKMSYVIKQHQKLK